LFTFRSEFKTDWSFGIKLELNHLDKTNIQEMVEKLVNRELNNGTLLEQIIDKSDGIPLYVEEITKTIVGFTNNKKSRSTVVPIKLNDYLMARLDKLEEAKQVAQAGSIIGREFDQRLLKLVLTSTQYSLNKSINKLVQDEIIFNTKPGQYLFKHALIRDAAYESIPKNKRKEFHRKTAEVLEDKFASIVENQPDLLAYHYEQAGENKKAITYLKIAGELAIGKYAPMEAKSQLIKGLDLLKSSSPSKQRDLLEISICKHLQYVLLVGESHNIDLVCETSERLVLLCEKWKLYDEVLDPLQLYVHHLYLISVQKMKYYLKKMNRYAKKVNNPRVDMSCLVVSGSAYAYMGKYATSSEMLNRAISFYESHKSTISNYQLDDGITALVQSAIIEWNLGYLDISINRLQKALILCRKSKGPNDLPFSLTMSSVIYLKRNQLRMAKQVSEEASKLCEDRGLYFYSHLMQIVFLNSSLKLNEDKDSLYPSVKELMECGITPCLVNSIFQENLVEILMLMNMYDKAIEFARNNIENYNINKMNVITAKIYKLYGDILLLKSKRNKKKAEECYIQSLDIARKQKTRFFELEAVNSYSKLLVNQGRDAEAKKMLSRIVRWFDGKNKTDIKELNEAKSLLNQIS